MRHVSIPLGLVLLVGFPVAGQGPSVAAPELPELAEPVVITAGGEPIAVEIGHAAPYVLDFDKDGKKDLVVGQFGGGKARVYLNVGSDDAPEFDEFTWLQAGGEDASVPPS